MSHSEPEAPQAPETRPAERPKRLISLGRAQIAGLACLPLIGLALLALGYARFAAGRAALDGLSMAGLPLAGLTGAEVKQRMDARARTLAAQKLRLRVGGREASLPSSELGITLAPVASSERAIAVGRSGGQWVCFVRYLRSFWATETLPAALAVDSARLQRALDGLEATLIDDPPFAGGVTLVQGRPRAEAPRAGRRIKRAAARDAIEGALSLARLEPIVLATELQTPVLTAGALERGVALAERVVAGSVVLGAAERRLEVSADELASLLVSSPVAGALELSVDVDRTDAWLRERRAGLEAPARDATFEVSAKDQITVVPAEPGLRLAAEDVAQALWKAAQSADRRGELPLRREPLPARSTASAEALGIRQLVGSFTTRHPCCQPRVANIHRIAQLMDGLVVEPGQTVSVNAVVGARTQKNGFVLAPGIEDGEMVDSVGGGVSQFATTFFNALLHAGYDIVERQPHTYWFPRYPMGHEATLSWPKPDIVFKNDSNAGLLVKTLVSKTTVTVKLYGDTGGRKVTSSVSERRDIVKPSVELLPNREIEPDEEKVKDGGMIGWSVIAARTVTFADGTKKEEKRKVTYKPKVRRVEVHPCRIPDGEPGATGEPCPEPEDVESTEPEVAAAVAQPG